MTFGPLALSKDTIRLYTAGPVEKQCGENFLCLRKRRPSDQKQVALTTPQLERLRASFTYSVGCLEKKKQDRE